MEYHVAHLKDAIGGICGEARDSRCVALRILLLDTVPGRAPVAAKEGSRLLVAFRRLGHEAEILGPGFTDRLDQIPSVAEDFDLCVLTDNYPGLWPWSDFGRIRIPKVFWAIDTHLQTFDFLGPQGFNFILFNNYTHMRPFVDRLGPNAIDGYAYFPYATDPLFAASIDDDEHFRIDGVTEGRDIVFVGTPFPVRQEAIAQFNAISSAQITTLEGYGQDYIDSILSGRININFPLSDDFNGRILEVLALGRLLLTPHMANSEFVIPASSGIYYSDLRDAAEKASYFLRHEDERRTLAERLREYVLTNHTYVARAEAIIEMYEEWSIECAGNSPSRSMIAWDAPGRRRLPSDSADERATSPSGSPDCGQPAG
jgi:hypothetical protein